MLDGLAKYLVALIKLSDEEASIKLVDDKLKELVNFELDQCIIIVDELETQWGNVARTTKRTTKEIKAGIEKRKQLIQGEKQ